MPYEIKTDPASGLPVPYVALWSDERVGPEMRETTDGIEPVPGTQWAKKHHGMWMMTGPNLFTGKPEFGATHSRRQRECMERQLCQVCGERKRSCLWVIPGGDITHELLWKRRMVRNPPVCEECLELASTVCPHLMSVEPLEVLTVMGNRGKPVAVTGDLIFHGRITPDAMAQLRSRECAWMLGRELVVSV